ncbi:MAG: phosphatidate cytidylyltransferase [Frankiales bacterium]|jgi:phosphatidate cytidylyltransferase|nr:phosphatidate cytidylyltransferase [Frankiales bacterium]
MSATLDIAPYVAGALGASGVGVALSRRRELIARWVTWAAAAPIVGGSLYFGAPGATVLAIGLGVIAAFEYARMMRLRHTDAFTLGAVATAAPIVAWVHPTAFNGPAPLLLLPLLAAVPSLTGGDTADGARRTAYVALATPWLVGLAGLVLLGTDALPLCIAVSVADVAAWCGGKTLGRRGPFARKLSPLSPAKTWGGVVGSMLGATAVLALCGCLRPSLLAAVVVGSVVGDLFESMLKRGAGVKDAGSWLPGFGGLLDRIDSLLVAVMIATVLR